MRCIVRGLTQKAELPPTHGVNRDSDHDSRDEKLTSRNHIVAVLRKQTDTPKAPGFGD